MSFAMGRLGGLIQHHIMITSRALIVTLSAATMTTQSRRKDTGGLIATTAIRRLSRSHSDPNPEPKTPNPTIGLCKGLGFRVKLLAE